MQYFYTQWHLANIFSFSWLHRTIIKAARKNMGWSLAFNLFFTAHQFSLHCAIYWLLMHQRLFSRPAKVSQIVHWSCEVQGRVIPFYSSSEVFENRISHCVAIKINMTLNNSVQGLQSLRWRKRLGIIYLTCCHLRLVIAIISVSGIRKWTQLIYPI